MGKIQRSLIIVEDEQFVASLLKDTLTHAGFEVQTCSSAAEAAKLVDAFDPDGALIDIHLGKGPTGLQLGQRLSLSHPHLGLVFLTKYRAPASSGGKEIVVPPGSAFLPKEKITNTELLLDVVNKVLQDSYEQEVSSGVIENPLNQLTDSQLEILRLAAMGLTNTAIANRRGTSQRTVEQRLQTVYQKLGIEVTGEVNPRVESILQYIEFAGAPSKEGS